MKIVKALVAIIAVGVAAYVVIHFQQRRQLADLNNRAMGHMDRQEYAQARDLLEQARRRDPSNYVIWKNLGISYDELKNVPKAIEAYERSLALNPNQPDVRNAVAILKRPRKGPDKKLPDLKLDGDLTEAQKMAKVGLTRERLSDETGAIDAYKRSLAMDPNQPEVRARLEALQRKTGRNPAP